jgi:hypothetical protein
MSEVQKEVGIKDHFAVRAYVKDKRYPHWDCDKIASRLNEVLNDTMKVSKPKHDKDDLVMALEVIDTINNLDEYARSYFGDRFDDVFIPKCLSDFVYPSRVSLKDDSRYPDLRYLYDRKEPGIYNHARMKKLIDNINAEFKINEPPVYISDLRKPVKLDDVNIMTVSNDGIVTIVDGSSKGFIPVLVKDSILDIYGERIFNEDANYVIERYLTFFKVGE